MVRNVHVKLNAGLLWQSSIQQEGMFYYQTELNFKKESSEVLPSDRSSVYGAEI
jgi:hypothetical protein